MKKKSIIREDIFVDTLEDYISQIMNLKKDGEKGVLWFRGHRNYHWSLTPTLYRGIKKNLSMDDSGYTMMKLREGMRQQQNHAKNYQFLKNDNLNPIEWMAIAQHHGVKTRMLDWSTSAIHALLFALEDRFSKSGDLKEETDLPCVWCLFPQDMNKYTVTEILLRNSDTISKFITKSENRFQNGGGRFELENFLDNAKKDWGNYQYIFFESKEAEDVHLNYLYNLAHFEEMLVSVEKNPAVAYEGGLVNPLHYILDKIYSTGIGIKGIELLPLAIIHPYHSERIRAQQGTFTIFPDYITEGEENFSEISDMRYMPGTEEYLNRLIIRYPDRIAKELMTIGAHRSWLYPEEPIVSQEIESGL